MKPDRIRYLNKPLWKYAQSKGIADVNSIAWALRHGKYDHADMLVEDFARELQEAVASGRGASKLPEEERRTL